VALAESPSRSSVPALPMPWSPITVDYVSCRPTLRCLICHVVVASCERCPDPRHLLQHPAPHLNGEGSVAAGGRVPCTSARTSRGISLRGPPGVCRTSPRYFLPWSPSSSATATVEISSVAGVALSRLRLLRASSSQSSASGGHEPREVHHDAGGTKTRSRSIRLAVCARRWCGERADPARRQHGAVTRPGGRRSRRSVGLPPTAGNGRMATMHPPRSGTVGRVRDQPVPRRGRTP